MDNSIEMNDYTYHKKKNSCCKICNYIIISIITIIISLNLSYKELHNVFSNSKHLYIESNENIHSQNDNQLPSEFYYLNENNTKGPITLDIKADDGTKTNFYEYFTNFKPEYLKESDNKRKTKISILMFSDKINPNSVSENAVSEMFQYANIHKYKFIFNHLNYNKDKDVHYMKLSVILEVITEGLKNKNIDWIFWVDNDISVTNPTIKLETFLPIDKNINLIAATDDNNGFDTGAFFIKVSQWSYNFIIDALSYSFFNEEENKIYNEQLTLNNILSDKNKKKNYVLVPDQWFNNKNNVEDSKGSFLIHLPNAQNNDEEAKFLREKINKDWYEAKDSITLRKEVLEYYNLPRSHQVHNGVLTHKE